MKLGVFTPVFGSRSFEAMLEAVCGLQLDAIELGTGGWPGSAHVEVDPLLANPSRAAEFRQRVTDAGLTISALSLTKGGRPVSRK